MAMHEMTPELQDEVRLLHDQRNKIDHKLEEILKKYWYSDTEHGCDFCKNSNINNKCCLYSGCSYCGYLCSDCGRPR